MFLLFVGTPTFLGQALFGDLERMSAIPVTLGVIGGIKIAARKTVAGLYWLAGRVLKPAELPPSVSPD